MKPYYQHAGITIYHGDCCDVMADFEPLSVDHVITDPPYASETHDGARTSAHDGCLVDFDHIEFDKLRSIMATASIACKRWMVATMDWRHVAKINENPPTGVNFVRFGVWTKPNGAPQFTGDRPATGWEAVAIMHKADEKMKWNGGGRHAVWSIPNVHTEHPTGKPPKLISSFITLFSDAGETILDPFMGIGTTLRVAKDHVRKAIGIEMNERYCEIAARKLDQEVFDFGTW